MTTRVWAGCVPALAAAREYVHAGIAPGGTHANWRFLADWLTFDPEIVKEEQLLLCDAQTSGGLLAAVPESQAEEVIAGLRSAGVSAAAIVGRIEETGDGQIFVSAG